MSTCHRSRCSWEIVRVELSAERGRVIVERCKCGAERRVLTHIPVRQREAA